MIELTHPWKGSHNRALDFSHCILLAGIWCQFLLNSYCYWQCSLWEEPRGKFTLFPFAMYEDFVKKVLSKASKCFILHQIQYIGLHLYTFIFVNVLYRKLLVFYFIQWAVICYYHYWPMGAPVQLACVLWMWLQHSLSTSLFSGTTRCSRLILYFLWPGSESGWFSKRASIFYWRMVFTNEKLGARHAQCY